MAEFKEFLNLFFRRLFRPLAFVWEKIYQTLPYFLKNLLISNILCLASLAILLIIILANHVWPKDTIMQAKLDTARWPVLPASHFQLAKVYFENGHEQLAKKEYQNAVSSFLYFAGIKIFPSWQKQAEETETLMIKKDQITEKIFYWEKILANKPYIRDVYLRLSLLYYQLWEDQKAKEVWDKAFYLDPNNQVVKEVGKIFGAE